MYFTIIAFPVCDMPLITFLFTQAIKVLSRNVHKAQGNVVYLYMPKKEYKDSPTKSEEKLQKNNYS